MDNGIFTALELLPKISTRYDIYTIQGRNTFLFAFHIYKGYRYIGTYTVESTDIDSALEKLINNEVKGFAFDGGFHKKFKSLKELSKL